MNNLSPELQEKVRKCDTPAEALALVAREVGREMSDEELEAIAGGDEWKSNTCPNCGSDDIEKCTSSSGVFLSAYYKCNACGYKWVPE